MASIDLRRLEHILATVAQALRAEFPEDFYKRCAYAAFGVAALLREDGIEAHAAGGDFMAFVMSHDGQQAVLQGFGFGEDQCSHFWVETDQRLIDLGPYFLPDDARFSAVPMPAVAWDIAEPLPRSIRYRAITRFFADAKMSSDPTISARCDAFVARCFREVRADTKRFPTWLVTGKASMRIAASRRNLWALGAERFERMADPRQIMF